MPRRETAKGLQDIGREHLDVCKTLAKQSSTLNGPLKPAASRLSVDDLMRAATSKDAASKLLYAPVEAFASGNPSGFYVDYVFNCSIFVACIEHEIDELLLMMSGAEAASALEMMAMTSLDSDDFSFILGSGGDMLDKLGDMLGASFYKLFVRAFRIVAIRRSQQLGNLPAEDAGVELDCEALRIEIVELLPRARSECEGNAERLQMIDQFTSLARG